MQTLTLRAIRQLGLLCLLTSCGLNPQSSDLDLNTSLPEAKVSLYTDAIRKLGMMNKIYGTAPLAVMSKDIADNTGSSTSTSFEIPRDITEMVKSTLNAVGGNVTYVQYDPGFINDAKILEFLALNKIKVPNVIVSGGITEFDRGLVTKGDSADADVTVGEYGLSAEDKNQASLAEVTLDFNLIDFKTSAGFPRIQAVNGIKLHKSVKEDSFAFTIKSITFGAKGNIKKVQGRHAAVRLLVELSMLQLLGRYQKLPYWRLLPNVAPDEVVLEQVRADFYEMNPAQRIAQVQTYLYLHGLPVRPTGQMDAATTTALDQFNKEHPLPDKRIDEATYLALYESIPIDAQTQARRKALESQGTQLALQTDGHATHPEVAAEKPLEQTQPKEPTPVTKDAAELKLAVSSDKPNIGDKMTVDFTVVKPMYVRVAYINSKGEITTLFPNPYQSDNFCKPGQHYQIPPAKGDFNLTVEGPKGIDKIRAVASEQKIAAGELFFTPQGEFDDGKMSRFKVRASADLTIQ